MPFTQGYALLIGVGSYRYEPRLNIPIMVSDAQAISEVLRDQQLCGYPPEQVRLLHDDLATKEGILGALEALAAQTTPEDTIALFYCGHGDYADDGSYYLTAHDTRVAGNKIVSGTGVSHGELLQKIKALPAKRVLLLFNACHSGEISPTLGVGEGEGEGFTGTPLPGDTAGALLGTGEGRIIITACREGQLSYVGSGAVSIFTQALVDGLQGKGVTSRHGYISAFDLYTSVYDVVTEAVRTRYNLQQEPELTIQKGVGPMAVSLYHGGATAAPTVATLGGDIEFDEEAQPPAHTAVREFSRQESEQLFQQIVRGGVALGQGTRVGGDVVGGDKAGGDVVRGNKVGGDNIRVGNISGTGIAIGRQARATVNERGGSDEDELVRAFAPIYEQIAARAQDPPAVKAILTDTVKSVENEAAKGEQADAQQIEGWLTVLARMAPDILEVAANALMNPVAGVAVTIQKVAERARQAGRG